MNDLTLTSPQPGNPLFPALERASAILVSGLIELGLSPADARLHAAAFTGAQAALLVQATAELDASAICAVVQTDDAQDLWLFVRVHGGQAGVSLQRHAQAVGLSLGTPSQALLAWTEHPGVTRPGGALRALRRCLTSQRAARTAARGLLATAEQCGGAPLGVPA